MSESKKHLQFCYHCKRPFTLTQSNCPLCGSEMESIQSIKLLQRKIEAFIPPEIMQKGEIIRFAKKTWDYMDGMKLREIVGHSTIRIYWVKDVLRVDIQF